MDYSSNLMAPDLRPHFKHLHDRVMGHSQGHSVLSDFADYPPDHSVFGLYKNCGLWTRDEAAILYECARRSQGAWADIGAHTGWTSAHVVAAGCEVDAIEPMLAVAEFAARFFQNTRDFDLDTYPCRSDEYFEIPGIELARFRGVVIDGDHGRPNPLNDAMHSAALLDDTGVILLHDFIGADVQEAVLWLMKDGFKCRVYWTPHMIACCYRGSFTPPDHVRDPRVDWTSVQRTMAGFPFERCV